MDRETDYYSKHANTVRSEPEQEDNDCAAPVSIRGDEKVLEACGLDFDCDVKEGLRKLASYDLSELNEFERYEVEDRVVDILKKAGVRDYRKRTLAALKRDSEEASVEKYKGKAISYDEPDPYPGFVSGTELLDELRSTIRRYLVLPDGGDLVLTLWIVHAHAHNCRDLSPVLAITSPVKRCGKSTVMYLLSALTPRGRITGGITSSSIFRLTQEDTYPTFLLDEAEAYLNWKNQELLGILNSGHTRAGAFVHRSVRIDGDWEVREFSTWAPKAVALIGKLPGTLEDRAIGLRMRRMLPNERVDELMLDRLHRFDELKSKIISWVLDHEYELGDIDPSVPDEITNHRARDNWRPLLAIADIAGPEWKKEARRVAVALARSFDESDTSDPIKLLVDVQKYFVGSGKEKVHTQELLDYLNGLEDRPWSEYRGSPLSGYKLSRLLSGFGIKPRMFKSVRGYRLSDFEDTYDRYLSIHRAVNSAVPQSGSDDKENCTADLVPTPQLLRSRSADSAVSDVRTVEVGAERKNGRANPSVVEDPWDPSDEQW